MLLQYFYDQKLAHASYMIGCQATGEAIVVDPGRHIAPYLRAAKANDLRIVAATETHIHADFVSGALRDLRSIGADRLGGYFQLDAIETLAADGYPISSYEEATPQQVAAGIQSGEYLLLDVRNEEEWAKGHIPGARHIMLGYLPQRAGELLNGQKVVVLCQSGHRSAIGASLLRSAGADAISLQGGLEGWQKADLPVEQ